MRLAFLAMILLASAATAEPSAELFAQLRQGGYVLFLRHTSTDFSQDDSRMKSFEDCATQRNLTDKGRAEARALGEHVKRLKIPIGEVLASPFCRTMETARLAFGKARATNDVRGGPLSADDPKRYQPLRLRLGTTPAAGTNTVLSSHGNPFRAVAGPPYLAEGEIAVVRPEGGEKFSVIARIRPTDW
jgi:hypothetical protein